MNVNRLNIPLLDVKKSTSGTPLVFNGVTFLVARMGNPEYQSAIAEAYSKVDMDSLTNEAAQEILDVLLATHCVCGWQGLADDTGEIPWSVETAIELLLNPQLEELLNWVRDNSENIENFRVERQKK
ncbi:MAG: hypothetical protein DRI46_12745 [Chloroflexi bacterium]|nr:MAG: hypothetical protein DRI46_12745 [Chloroflexota bacterium]